MNSINNLKVVVFLLTLITLFNACKPKHTMEITQKQWGTVDGKEVLLFTLTNAQGMKASITNYGAIVQSLWMKDKDGNVEDIVLGFDSLEGYLKNSPYFGAIVGRYGNRIGKARFVLDGNEYQVTANDGPNHLHGGLKGFDKVVWDARPFVDSAGPCLELHYLSRDGEEGYPGNLDVYVTYCLTTNNELRIDYRATTDQPTVVNLTHHGYFNLSGNARRSILDHKLQILADNYTPVDSLLIPTGEIKPVEGTPFDFRQPKTIGLDIQKVFNKKTGFDNNFVLRSGSERFRKVALLSDTVSGRFVEVWTDQPGIQFYSGNFLDGTLKGKNGVVYPQYWGLCLETQHFPDSPNKPWFPPVVLRPGEVYETQTIYKFGVIR